MQNIDLYAQFGAAPTLTQYLKRSYGNVLLVTGPSGGGTLHVGVYGREASSYRLTTATE